jgi:hypothetical protein
MDTASYWKGSGAILDLSEDEIEYTPYTSNGGSSCWVSSYSGKYSKTEDKEKEDKKTVTYIYDTDTNSFVEK